MSFLSLLGVRPGFILYRATNVSDKKTEGPGRSRGLAGGWLEGGLGCLGDLTGMFWVRGFLYQKVIGLDLGPAYLPIIHPCLSYL